MKRLLNTKAKQTLRDTYRNNVLFKTVNAAYKPTECAMETLRFSTEEIWANSIIVFDDMLRHPDSIGETADSLWDTLFCQLRDEANDTGRCYGPWELETATSCIVCVTALYMLASGEYRMMRHVNSLLEQTMEKTPHAATEDPLMDNVQEGFAEYIRKYIAQQRYISSSLDSPLSPADPVKPVLTARDKTEMKDAIRRRIAFMSGATDKGQQIMTPTDFNQMTEAVDYLVENHVVKIQDRKIETALPLQHLYHTFYLVYKNEGKPIGKTLWVDFLTKTFSAAEGKRDTISKHWSHEPSGYSYNRTAKRRKTATG